MLRQIAKGVWVHESECVQANATIVDGKNGVLLVDVGLTSGEMISIADDLATLGKTVELGFSTHPHWDHVLWHERFGDVPRYSTAEAAAQMQAVLSSPNWKEEEAAGLPEEIAGEVPLDDLYGKITPLPSGAATLPWSGSMVKIIEHSGHAPGHAALFVEECKVLIAGDMLSDVFIPMLNPAASNPMKDYLMALEQIKREAGNAEFIIPGHGSVGVGSEVMKRIDQDSNYVEALRDGVAIEDLRVTSPKKGWEWVADIHNWQLQTVTQKSS